MITDPITNKKYNLTSVDGITTLESLVESFHKL